MNGIGIAKMYVRPIFSFLRNLKWEDRCTARDGKNYGEGAERRNKKKVVVMVDTKYNIWMFGKVTVKSINMYN
jgi:hypothetical protein